MQPTTEFLTIVNCGLSASETADQHSPLQSLRLYLGDLHKYKIYYTYCNNHNKGLSMYYRQQHLLMPEVDDFILRIVVK